MKNQGLELLKSIRNHISLIFAVLTIQTLKQILQQTIFLLFFAAKKKILRQLIQRQPVKVEILIFEN